AKNRHSGKHYYRLSMKLFMLVRPLLGPVFMESLVGNLPTDLLRTFVVINQAGGFTLAGYRLGRSQPAISLQMKRLEELLDAQLFDRTSGLKLTEDGQLLMSYAQKILELNDAVVNQLQQPKVSGLVRLGIPNDLEMSFLAVT